MEYSEFMLDFTEKLKKETNQVPFKDDDVRKDFFGLLYDGLDVYYKGFLLFEISKLTTLGKAAFDKTVPTVHIVRMAEIYQIDLLSRGYLNSLNRNLFMGVWSSFELCVTGICSAIIQREEYDKLLSHQFRDLFKKIKKDEISSANVEILKGYLTKAHLSHVPITRKTDLLFNYAKSYSGDIKADKEFLIFFGKLRNSSHANFIYYGKDYDYNFGDANFAFRDGKLVKWLDPFGWPSPKLTFYLVNRIKEIFSALISAIKFEEMIPYPDLDLY